MSTADIEEFLRALGVPAVQVSDMASQLDKRAWQLARQKGQSYEESLAHLVALLRQGWAGQTRAAATPSPIRKWVVTERLPEADLRIFKSQWRIAVSPRTGEKHKVLVLRGSDWVNVIALTPQREVVLIEQYRHGIEEVTLEIPGGLIHEGESPGAAGARELREETGFAGEEPRLLGTVHPNPAFQSNLCHTVLVPNARQVGEPQFDSGEDIVVHLTPLGQIPQMIREGRITHSLVIVAFYWLHLRGETP